MGPGSEAFQTGFAYGPSTSEGWDSYLRRVSTGETQLFPPSVVFRTSFLVLTVPEVQGGEASNKVGRQRQ